MRFLSGRFRIHRKIGKEFLLFFSCCCCFFFQCNYKKKLLYGCLSVLTCIAVGKREAHQIKRIVSSSTTKQKNKLNIQKRNFTNSFALHPQQRRRRRRKGKNLWVFIVVCRVELSDYIITSFHNLLPGKFLTMIDDSFVQVSD